MSHCKPNSFPPAKRRRAQRIRRSARLVLDVHHLPAIASFDIFPASDVHQSRSLAVLSSRLMATTALDEQSHVDQLDQLARSSPRRFNRLLATVLGSPFVTTSDLPQDALTVMRMVVGDDFEAIDGAFSAVPRVETVTRPPSPTPSFSTDTYSFVDWTENIATLATQPRPSLSDAAPTCSFISGSARRSIPLGQPGNISYSPYNTLRSSSSGSMKGSRSLNGLIPRLWDVLRESSPTKKGKRRLDLSLDFWNELSGDGYIDYASLPPLDGEEGELIDDEACFIDVRAVTGLGECRISQIAIMGNHPTY